MMNDEPDISELIASDTNSLINSLLIYQMAAKILSPAEVSFVVDGGSDTIINEIGTHMDKNMVEKIAKDTAQNMKDLICKLRLNYQKDPQ